SRPASLSPGTGPETAPLEQSASWSRRSGPQASRTVALSVPLPSGYSALYTPRTDIHNTQRHRQDIISDALTGVNTGTSVVNSLDIQGLNEKVEQLKGVKRDLLARSLTHQAEQAFLGEEGAHLQLDGIAVLETHDHTINRLIDRGSHSGGTAVPCVWPVDGSPDLTQPGSDTKGGGALLDR
ncbi:hypothetical protein chiPu_0032508, partial [Chiloscyllium punctatum]|nr:hypothetical protein [Chiloscyllium punctatum]